MTNQEIVEYAKECFPFDTFNRGQLEAIVACVDGIVNKDKFHIFIEAPTGIGKSVIATTVHKILRKYNYEHRTTIATATKGLQDQYQSTPDADIFDLKGMQTYGCSCGNHDAWFGNPKCFGMISQSKCTPENDCEYVRTRDYWKHDAVLRSTSCALQIVSPYEFTGIRNEKTNTRADLIVVDECHKLEEQIISACTLNLNKYVFGENMCDADDDVRNVQDMINALILRCTVYKEGHVFKSHNSESVIEEHARIIISELMDISEKYKSMKTKSAVERQIAQKVFQIANELAMCVQARTIILNRIEHDYMQLKPVFAKELAYNTLFCKADYFIHMSATICGMESYAESLGIKSNDYLAYAFDNPIPVENRRIVYIPMYKMSGGDIPRQKIIGMAKDIAKIRKEHEGENGVVHTVSYKLADSLQYNSIDKDGMYILKDRERIVELMKTQKGVCLLSPSVEEGYDFKDDDARFQVIAKMPFGYLGDPLIKLNCEQRPDSYGRATVLRVVQACGRTTRGMNDYSTTYILDKNFGMLLARNEKFFPKWFLDAIEWYDPEDLK